MFHQEGTDDPTLAMHMYTLDIHLRAKASLGNTPHVELGGTEMRYQVYQTGMGLCDLPGKPRSTCFHHPAHKKVQEHRLSSIKCDWLLHT